MYNASHLTQPVSLVSLEPSGSFRQTFSSQHGFNELTGFDHTTDSETCKHQTFAAFSIYPSLQVKAHPIGHL